MQIAKLVQQVKRKRLSLREDECAVRDWAIRQVRDRGRKQVEVAKELGLTRGRIHQWVKEARP